VVPSPGLELQADGGDGIHDPMRRGVRKLQSEVLYDDWIQVKVWVSEVKRASLKFEYEVVTSRRQALYHRPHLARPCRLGKEGRDHATSDPGDAYPGPPRL